MAELNEYMSYFLNPLSTQNNRFVFKSMLNIISVTKKNVNWTSIAGKLCEKWLKKRQQKSKCLTYIVDCSCESSKQKTHVIKQTLGEKRKDPIWPHVQHLQRKQPNTDGSVSRGHYKAMNTPRDGWVALVTSSFLSAPSSFLVLLQEVLFSTTI